MKLRLWIFLLSGVQFLVANDSKVIEAIFRKTSLIDRRDALSLPKICNIQNNVVEVLEELETTQSAIDVLIDAQGFISTFGEEITSPVEDIVNIQFQYGIADIDITTSVVSTGTFFEVDSLAKVSTGTASDGLGRIESKRTLRYRPGHEGYAFFTGLWESNAANSTQFIGLFDDNDGAAVGYNGTTFSILFRREGETDTFIPQSSFNRDKLDGTGTSSFTINTTKLNIFRISYGWLGTAPIKFQVNREDGKWITFHVIERPNTTAGTHFKNPVLPIRMESKNNGNTTDLRMATASWNAGIVGVPTVAGSRFFSKSNILDISAGGEQHVLTIRNKSVFQGRDNKVEVRIAAIGGGSLVTMSEVILFRIRRNATVTGTSFSDVNTTSSVVEFSTAGTYSAGTGEEIFIFPTNNFGSGPQILFLPSTEFTILMFPGETITLTGVSLVGVGGSTNGILTWEERF